MRVKDIMTSPVLMVGPDRHLKDVARLLLDLRIGAAPVVDADGRLVGIVSERDLVALEELADPRAHALPQAPAALAAPVTVRQVMTTRVTTLCEQDDVADAARLMVIEGHRTLPVVDGDRVVGVVTMRDLLRVLARGDDDIRTELLALLDELAGAAAPHVEVADGVVTFTGPADPAHRQLPELLARTVPGVVGIRFEVEVEGGTPAREEAR